MKFNFSDLLELSFKNGDQEGRLTYKPPGKGIYESTYKERWFKMKGNLLFSYKLNELGVVEKNEPHSLFILENFTVEKDDEDLHHPHGFCIIWKDPLEHFGTPLPVRSYKGMLISPSKASPRILENIPRISHNKSLSQGMNQLKVTNTVSSVSCDSSEDLTFDSQRSSTSISSGQTNHNHIQNDAKPSRSTSVRSEGNYMTNFTSSLSMSSPALSEKIPERPPRGLKDRKPSQNQRIMPLKSNLPRGESFKSHIMDIEESMNVKESINSRESSYSESSSGSSKSSFVSHLKGSLSQDELDEFLK